MMSASVLMCLHGFNSGTGTGASQYLPQVISRTAVRAACGKEQQLPTTQAALGTLFTVQMSQGFITLFSQPSGTICSPLPLTASCLGAFRQTRHPPESAAFVLLTDALQNR